MTERLEAGGAVFTDEERGSSEERDVVVIGGGYSGASAAILLKRGHPERRVLLVERREAADRKVGEATIELSALFMIKALGLSTYLALNHLPKHGLRYWYLRPGQDTIGDPSEIGAWDCAHLPTYLLARDRLDEHLMELAEEQGVEIVRPARVRRVELDTYRNCVEILQPGGRRLLRAPWIIDASGRGTLLARRFGWLDRDGPHRIGAIWARWKNTFDLDGLDPDAPSRREPRTQAPRTLCTNHLAARGSWIWFIPLASGETSVGIVYHHDDHALHERSDRRSAYLDFLDANPIGRRWLRDAELLDDDLRCLPLLPHVTRHYAGEGHALVGDAAGFIDPFYSPGLDHCSQSVMATVELVGRYFEEGASAGLRGAIERHDARFRLSYQRLRDAIYVHKYRYMGEWDLFRAAYLLEVPGYFLALARPSWRNFEKHYCVPAFTGPGGALLYRIGCFYNRRLAAIADRRVALGQSGAANAGRRLSPVFDLRLTSIFHYLVLGALYYLRAEAGHLWSVWTKAAVAAPNPGEGQARAGAARALGPLPEAEHKAAARSPEQGRRADVAGL